MSSVSVKLATGYNLRGYKSQLYISYS